MHKIHNFLEVDFLSDFDTPIFLKVDFFNDSDTSIFLVIFLVIHSDIWRIVDKGSLINWIVGGYPQWINHCNILYGLALHLEMAVIFQIFIN